MKRAVIAVLALMIIAGGAFAQHRGGGPGHGGGGRGGDPGAGFGNAIVGADGTLFLVSDDEIRAINTSGATVWTKAIEDRGRLVLSGSNLLSVSDSSTSTAVSTTITAYAAATGATAWTKTFEGRVTGLEPFSGGTYVFVVVPPATQGALATRSLVAVSNSGATLWTVTL